MYADAGDVVIMCLSVTIRNLAEIFMLLQLACFVIGFKDRRFFTISAGLGAASVIFRLIWFWEVW